MSAAGSGNKTVLPTSSSSDESECGKYLETNKLDDIWQAYVPPAHLLGITTAASSKAATALCYLDCSEASGNSNPVKTAT